MTATFTPAGLQRVRELTRRRRVVACVGGAFYAGLVGWLAAILASDGWGLADTPLLIAFAIAAPWGVVGGVNAAIGLWLTHFRAAGVFEAAPFLAAGDGAAPLTQRVAVLLTIRNEDAARAVARLRAMKASVDGVGEGALFDWFVLSDTNDADVAAQEEAAVAAWRATAGDDASRLHYRRRVDNRGYKAGNISDFCARYGRGYDVMLPLVADSLMDGETIVRMARIAEAFPKLGILQSLVVGAPSRSAFARIFQFGMRHGMRSYTLGATWWAGDCGPYWGHNALIRIAPFTRACALPTLRGGGDILSHDQVEAALMRRAGYEVRVLPLETGSLEENPPTLVDFVTRDLRWCRGNMQYLRLPPLPGLAPMSRYQLAWAVSMFLGAPASTVILLLAPVAAANVGANFDTASLRGFYLFFLLLHLAPKLAGYADVLMTPGGLRRYGGGARFFASACVETLASFVIGAVTSLSVTIFLARSLAGGRFEWRAQAREARALTVVDAFRAFAPHAWFGALLFVAGCVIAPDLRSEERRVGKECRRLCRSRCSPYH
jgi:membrane glycosyltransferase